MEGVERMMGWNPHQFWIGTFLFYVKIRILHTFRMKCASRRRHQERMLVDGISFGPTCRRGRGRGNIQFPMRTFNVMKGIIFPASISFLVPRETTPRNEWVVNSGKWILQYRFGITFAILQIPRRWCNRNRKAIVLIIMII